MARPASSTAAQPTTYVTFHNPSVLRHLARKALVTTADSFALLEYNGILQFVFDCLLGQRLIGLLRAADMPTPLIWTKLTAVSSQPC